MLLFKIKPPVKIHSIYSLQQILLKKVAIYLSIYEMHITLCQYAKITKIMSNPPGETYGTNLITWPMVSPPTIFTKLFKRVYATLLSQGHVSFGYIDHDFYLQGDSIRECKANVYR